MRPADHHPGLDQVAKDLTRGADASISWVSAVPVLIGLAAVIGFVYWWDRTYRRWLKENHPLAGPRARLEAFEARYEQRRATATELARFIIDVVGEVNRVTPTRA